MGFCKQRYFMFTICFLQILAIVQREVFDFLGYLWIPIVVNLFQIIFVIFGFFGAVQYRPKYLVAYTIWHCFWMGWNIFLICLYLDIGILDHKENKVIKLDPDSNSWWSQNGPGCQGTLNVTDGIPTFVDKNCLIDYTHVEIFQAGLQCFLGFFGMIVALCLNKNFSEEDDSFNYISGDGKRPQHVSLRPTYVEGAPLLLPAPSFRTSKTDSLLSLHSNRSRVTNATINKSKLTAIHTDLVRFQNPVYRTSSCDGFDSLKWDQQHNLKRPKSMHHDADAY